MNKLKTISITLLISLTFILHAGQQVIRTDGRVYKNVYNLQDSDDFVIFDMDSKNYSIPKHLVKKIIDDDGTLIYEKQDLIVKSSLDESNIYNFYRNGVLLGRGKWLDAGKFKVVEGDIPDGVYKLFYDSGELKRTFSVKDGSLNGVCKVFYRSGKVEREGFYKNGEENGKSLLYYPTGKLKGFSFYQHGIKHGSTKLFYESGKVKAILNFKYGRPYGEQVMYYENGKPSSRVFYDDNGKNGPVTFYYESGKVKLQGQYVNDQLNGLVTTYYESGRVKKRETFRYGRVLQK